MKQQTSPVTTPATNLEKTGTTGKLVRPETVNRVWNPWSEMADLRRRMDDLFNVSFGYTPLSRMIPAEFVEIEPEVDIHETENALFVLASLPGYTLEQIDVQVTPENLIIKGKREPLFTKEPITTHVNTGISGSGSFNFVYTLPVQINPNGVKATFANGVLNLELPKVVPTVAETVKVPITAA